MSRLGEWVARISEYSPGYQRILLHEMESDLRRQEAEVVDLERRARQEDG